MTSENKIPIRDEDVFALTVVGSDQLRGAETTLSPNELRLLVRIDGVSTVIDILKGIQKDEKAASADAVIEIFRGLLHKNLIDPVNKTKGAATDDVDFFADGLSLDPPTEALRAATGEAAAGISTLQQQGYYVRIARRPTAERELAQGERLSVLIVEDEPHLGKLLRQFLAIEGFVPRVATKRDEIVAELRRSPPPDLVLLDVKLPDADGFDILLRMRQHPALNKIPVIMLTGRATREAVLQGLAGGADGYITKPFEVEVLVKAVKAVLGLSPK